MNLLNAKDLRKLDFDFQEPFQIQLEDDAILNIDTVLRILPGKRLVAIAEFNQERIVAKLFFSKKHALYHAKKETQGAQNLAKMKIPSPNLLTTILSKDKTVHILLFQHLANADNLYTLWQEKPSIDVLYPVLQQMTQEIATQHVLGVLQQDIHFKNFMLTPHKVFTLDGAQLTLHSEKLNKETSMRHLALFFSQMGVGFEEIQQQLFLYYAKLRGWLIKPKDIKEFFFLIRDANRARWKRHEKKIFRESSLYAVIKSKSFMGMQTRTFPKEMRAMLENPEEFFAKEHIVLKRGRSATVIRVRIGDHDWVIKRYNIKNFFHRIKRAFSISRAKKSWYHSQKLDLFGIAIPKPIAFIEKKHFFFKSQSYFISEYVEGYNLNKIKEDLPQDDQLIKNISHLLKQLSLIECTHGDLKDSNIIINAKTPLLVDFDGTKEHATLMSLRKETLKDWQRFLKNFVELPLLKNAFYQALFKKSD